MSKGFSKPPGRIIGGVDIQQRLAQVEQQEQMRQAIAQQQEIQMQLQAGMVARAALIAILQRNGPLRFSALVQDQVGPNDGYRRELDESTNEWVYTFQDETTMRPLVEFLREMQTKDPKYILKLGAFERWRDARSNAPEPPTSTAIEIAR